jgi:FkbM family methyltransferase
MSRLFQCVKKNINFVFGLLNLTVVSKSAYYQTLLDHNKANVSRYEESRNGFLINYLTIVEDHKAVIEHISSSKSQLFQDLYVLERMKWKHHGYFVEFGATNGKDLSNTYLLEKDFSWKGLLVEPGKNWHKELKENRSVDISHKCVWKSDGEMISFNESIYPEFSTINSLTDFDGMQKSRVSTNQYLVETVSLQKLLDDHESPKYIDYISIDTEGSEYEILNSFDFSRYEFGILTVEHNYNRNETMIDDLLSRNGYIRVHREVSNFDGWYINTRIFK